LDGFAVDEGMSQALKATTCVGAPWRWLVGISHTTTVLLSRYSAHFRRQRAANSSGYRCRSGKR
jgi:hypothetical protein